MAVKNISVSDARLPIKTLSSERMTFCLLQQKPFVLASTQSQERGGLGGEYESLDGNKVLTLVEVGGGSTLQHSLFLWELISS